MRASASVKLNTVKSFQVSWTLCLIRTIVQDLASRFADGRLSTEKVLDSEDEELYEMLIAVRGIGRVSSCVKVRIKSLIYMSSSGQVSALPQRRAAVHNDTRPVDMFAMFSLRRPDILPVGSYPLP